MEILLVFDILECVVLILLGDSLIMIYVRLLFVSLGGSTSYLVVVTAIFAVASNAIIGVSIIVTGIVGIVSILAIAITIGTMASNIGNIFAILTLVRMLLVTS